MANKVMNAVFAIPKHDKEQVMLAANRRSQETYRWSFTGDLVDRGETLLKELSQWDYSVNFTYRVDRRGQERTIRRVK